jgi:hypothetical protein
VLPVTSDRTGSVGSRLGAKLDRLRGGLRLAERVGRMSQIATAEFAVHIQPDRSAHQKHVLGIDDNGGETQAQKGSVGAQLKLSSKIQRARTMPLSMSWTPCRATSSGR